LSSDLDMPSVDAPGMRPSGDGWVEAAWPAGVPSPERSTASIEADDSGTGERAMVAASLATAGGGGGAAGGAGSLLRGAVTEVSPVNGFLYSVCDVMTSREVGL
jgi:hypothetical protein